MNVGVSVKNQMVWVLAKVILCGILARVSWPIAANQKKKKKKKKKENKKNKIK